jgi:hypothetical protein
MLVRISDGGSGYNFGVPATGLVWSRTFVTEPWIRQGVGSVLDELVDRSAGGWQALIGACVIRRCRMRGGAQHGARRTADRALQPAAA